MSNENPYQKTDLNTNIHGLRGFAAFTVLIYHLYRGAVSAGQGHIDKGRNFWPDDWFHQFIAPAMSSLNAGIEIFFMISGYLITLTLIRHNSIKKFVLNRVIRIYPTFLATQVLMFTIGPIVGWAWMKSIGLSDFCLHLISNLLFLPGIFELPIALPAAWTLSFEAAFYIISALTFVASKKARPFLIYTGLFLIALYVLKFYPRGIYFYVGTVVYFFENSVREKKWDLNRIPLLPMVSFLVIMTLLEFEFYRTNLWIYAGTMIPGFLFFYFVVKGKGFVSRVLRTKTFQFLGSISYSLYLWQVPVMYPIKRALLKYMPETTNKLVLLYSFSLLSIITCIIFSWISFKIFEVYIPKRLKAWAYGRETRKNTG